MMVMREFTALVAISTVVRTGRNAPPGQLGRDGAAAAGPMRRARPRNTTSGMPMLPKSPSGSRAKIFSSSHVSLRSARRAIIGPIRSYSIEPSIPHRVPGQLEKHVFQVRPLRPEFGHRDAVLGDTLNHVGDDALGTALEG